MRAVCGDEHLATASDPVYPQPRHEKSHEQSWHNYAHGLYDKV
jgi:hypothetical protein